MSKDTDDLQMLRHIKAFQRIVDRDTRRTIVLYIEEQAQRKELQQRSKAPSRLRAACIYTLRMLTLRLASFKNRLKTSRGGCMNLLCLIRIKHGSVWVGQPFSALNRSSSKVRL
ncbi:hypothetical protein [Bradyrhizobium sp. 131]|uniref:hypothetical protein n=1 Tax=Bradyrhizobium sp. 131 TaxID=2782609 RepID=UPI001FFFF4E7|nr:hypothetical protein [Bradyrhizobium sp. 131]UPK19168.1 hypothetical protein IVA73_34980 [Bradyrhizobium sp. 131]